VPRRTTILIHSPISFGRRLASRGGRRSHDTTRDRHSAIEHQAAAGQSAAIRHHSPPTHDCLADRFASTENTMEKPLDVKDLLRSFYPVLILVAAVEVLLWVHWNSLVYMANMWDNDKYSHGYLVPLFAIGLMWWYRKNETTEIVKPVAIAGGVLVGFGLLLCGLPLIAWDMILPLTSALGNTVLEAIGVGCAVAGAFLLLQPRLGSSDVPIRDRWIGFAILMAAQALRVFATVAYIDTLESFTFIPALAGVFVMAGGLRVLRWSGWPIVFLVFMLPLPGPLDAHLSGRLQSMATRSSTFLLQTVGMHAYHNGNDIYIGDATSPLQVEAACSGLRMLTIFGAISFAVALLCGRPPWQRLTILASWIPIALAVNIFRITLTGAIFALIGGNHEQLQDIFHTLWGWVMMPMALGLMFVEFKILDNLFIEDDEDLAPPIAFSPPLSRQKAEKDGSAQLIGTKSSVAVKAKASPAPNGGGTNGGGAALKTPARERTPN
jgi:exosortase